MPILSSQKHPQTASLSSVGLDHLWKQELQQSRIEVGQLLEQLELGWLYDEIDTEPDFRLQVPAGYVEKIQRGNARDPLLLQILPLLKERSGSGLLDPVSDMQFSKGPGLLHKYHGRALLVTTGACAINCRYCFRRHFPYNDASSNNKNIEQALRYLQQHQEIDEIILSGGDPLMLSDTRLTELIGQLEKIDHLRTLRIHSRLPVVLPSRINPPLLKLFASSRFRIVLVIHSNHANEISTQEASALAALNTAGISLLNQSVLLKDVNDAVDTLVELSKTLFEHHVMPYYLHLLDPVKGAMHFDVDEQKACNLIAAMRSKLPGYLVPKLVREIANCTSKTAISRN